MYLIVIQNTTIEQHKTNDRITNIAVIKPSHDSEAIVDSLPAPLIIVTVMELGGSLLGSTVACNVFDVWMFVG